MLFRVKVGRHVQGDRVYAKDEVIETDVNLIEKFDDQKFERCLELEHSQSVKTRKVKQKGNAPAQSNPLGEDVTDNYDDARDNGILVYRKGKKFFVVDTDEPDVVQNKEPLAEDDVAEFIDSLFE